MTVFPVWSALMRKEMSTFQQAISKANNIRETDQATQNDWLYQDPEPFKWIQFSTALPIHLSEAPLCSTLCTEALTWLLLSGGRNEGLIIYVHEL